MASAAEGEGQVLTIDKLKELAAQIEAGRSFHLAPPLEDKIGEYVLLKRYSHRPLNLLSWMTLYLVEPRRQGQKRERKKELPVQVRHAVLMSFKASHGRLSNGVSTLRRHRLLPRLEWACEFANVTDQILVWHVVTTRCDWMSRPRRPRRRGDDDDHHDDVGGDNWNRVVATKLSNYCAYLVAFVPEMLPDPSYNAEQIFDTAVRQTRCHLASCGTKQEILAQLDKIEANEWKYMEGLEAGVVAEERAGSKTIVERAALLGGQLDAAVGRDGERLWLVLAEFWAELLLFLAPSDNVDAHAEKLGAGGEFMTQLWALLAHAGVLERPTAGAAALATATSP